MLPVTSAPVPGAREEQQVVAVLGPVAVLSDAGPVAPRGTRAAALVVLLALAAPRAVPVSTLVDALWGDGLPANPRAALQSLVSRLRSLGPDVVRSTPAGYALGGPSDLDRAHVAAARARELLENGSARQGGATAAARHDGATAAALLDDARALWRGDPGDGLDDAVPGITAELQEAAERLRDELTGLRRRAAVVAEDHATVTALGTEALAANPLDEDAARDVMTALAASGRPDEAVRVFGRLRHTLVAELGTDPAPDLVALHARITDSPDGAAPDTPDRRPGAGRFVRGLRAAATPLIGRADDVRAVLGELSRHRVVTILGAGGLGKTRLAHEVARTVAEDRSATASVPLAGLSIAVAELAGVRTDDDVALAIADGLGVSSAAGSARLADRLLAGDLHDRIVERARTARTLLVLDNCEHVPDGAARWTDVLLSAAPGLRILATSRAPLQVAAEQVYPLAPLASGSPAGTPGNHDGNVRGPAVELFRQRALAARPGAQLPDDVVARLCDRLDGLPLAIELAAARVRTLSIEEIERHLGERFALLRGGDRTVPDRHRTLEAVIEWSWNLLEPSQRELWQRVSVLPDGLSAQAAAALGRLGGTTLHPEVAVPLDVLDDIDGLVVQSLLVVEEGGPAPVRYRMLETVREFGLLRLAESGEADAVRDALLDWADGVARHCTSRMLGPEQVPAVMTLRREHENLLFAIRAAARAGRPEIVIHGYLALGGAWTLRGTEERVADLAPAVLDAVTGWRIPDAEVDATALALTYATATTAFSGTTASLRALARLRRLLRERGDAMGARTRTVAGMLLAPVPETLLPLRESADPLVAFLAHLAMAQEAENAGRIDEALAAGERAYHLAHGIGDVASLAGAAMLIASTASGAGHTATAVRWSRIARPGLTALAADGALRQLDWVDLTAALDDGDLAEAERICAALDRAGTDADESDRGGVESHAVAGVGWAEIAYLRGDVAGALTRYESAVGTLAGVPGASPEEGAQAGPADPHVVEGLEPDVRLTSAAPWAIILGSAWAVRLVDAGQDERARQVADAARRLSVTMYPERRRNSVDHPVLGTVCLMLAVLLTQGEPPADVGQAGLDLLALSEALGSREDLRALRRAPVFAAVTERFGAQAVADARARAAAIDRAELGGHVLATLGRQTAPRA